MVDLSKLNSPQREAAAHVEGPLLVLAGAGSGKTRVITFRIAHLLDLGVPPEAICAVTFTNKAAEEMRERVAHLLHDKKTARALTIGTFHALGLHILKSERRALGMPRGFAIYDQADQLGTVREAIRHVRDMGRDGERKFDAKAVLTRISLAKNQFIAPADFKGNPADDYDAMTAEVYPKYQEMLRSCGAFDFDDLICEPVRLWERDAGARRRWAERFKFVMCDEFQDTNGAQIRLVQGLVSAHNNLVVVGDDDQSIYSWRGADPTNILRFDQTFKGAKVIKLEQNYRSTKTILDAANTVIANNTQRHGKVLWSQIPAGEKITHAVAPTAEDEAKWVAMEIRRLHQEGRTWDSIAVMYRSNIQAKVIEEELRTHEIPYVMYGGQQFFERKEVKDLIAYLRVALNPRDDLAIRRVINYPARGIGAGTIEKLAEAGNQRGSSLWDVLRGIAHEPSLPGLGLDLPAPTFADEDRDEVNPRAPMPALDVSLQRAAKNGILGFVHVIQELADGLGHDVVAATKALIEDIALYDDLRDASGSQSAAQRRMDNVTGLLASLARFTEKGKGKEQLGEYLRALSLESSGDDDKDKDRGPRVVLTTLHGAKGLEFPICFMIGLEEELLPHARTLQPQATDVIDPDHAMDISEERRLCYVGITRAQRKLYLTRACTRVSRGRLVPRTPSRFLLEVPDELLEIRDLGSEAKMKVPEAEVSSFFASFALDK